MRSRPLLVAALLFALLLAWSVLDRRRPASTRRVEDALLPWQPLDEDALSRLEIRDKGALAAVLRRTEGEWLLYAGDQREPLRADAEMMQAATAALRGLRSERTITAAGSRADYGLDEGARELRFTLRGGSRHTLRLGAALLVGAGRSCLVDGTLHVLPAGPLLALDRDPRDYVDRRLLPLQAKDIDAIELLDRSDPLRLQRHGRAFVLPDGRRADLAQVGDLLAALGELSLERLVPAGAARGAPWLQAHAGPRRVEVERTAEGALVRGPTGSHGTAAIQGLLSDPGLPPLPSADALWTEQVVDIDPVTLQALRWIVGAEETRYVKTPGGWTRQTGQGQRSAPEEAVEAFAHRLAALHGRPRPARSLGDPVATVAGTHADGTRFGLRLMSSDDGFEIHTDQEPGAARPADAETVALLTSPRPRFAGEPAP